MTYGTAKLQSSVPNEQENIYSKCKADKKKRFNDAHSFVHLNSNSFAAFSPNLKIWNKQKLGTESVSESLM